MNNCINSSKVYCKFTPKKYCSKIIRVLIVAKCIVNMELMFLFIQIDLVLIVAKCNVKTGYSLIF